MKNAWSIRIQLTMLVLAMAVPLAMLFAYSVYNQLNKDMRNAAEQAQRLAEITATDARTFLRNREHVLARIAQHPDVQLYQSGRCNMVMEEFRSYDTSLSNVVVLNMEGVPVCSAIPLGNAKPRLDSFRRAIRENRFAIGKPLVGTFSKKWILPLSYPIRDEHGKILGVLGAAVDLVNYVPVTGVVSLPAGSNVTLVNSAGTVIARSTEPEKWVGKNITGTEVMREILAQQDGQAHLIGLDGHDMIYAFNRIPGSDWYALVALRTDTMLADSRNAARREAKHC